MLERHAGRVGLIAQRLQREGILVLLGDAGGEEREPGIDLLQRLAVPRRGAFPGRRDVALRPGEEVVRDAGELGAVEAEQATPHLGVPLLEQALGRSLALLLVGGEAAGEGR